MAARAIKTNPTPPLAGTPWIAFAFLAIAGFTQYGLGAATPYLRTDLRLTAFEAGLHASALAVGALTAGATADRIARAVGLRRLPDLEALLIVIGVVMLALAPGLPVSLAGAGVFGLGSGILGMDVNLRFGRYGSRSRVVISQAHGLAMVAAVLSPVAIGLAFSELHNWRIALGLPIVAILALVLFRTRPDDPQKSARVPRARLPRAYWIVWLFIGLAVSIEFSFVYWSSTMVAQRAGIDAASATLMASLFVVGMLVGRLASGGGMGAGRSPRLMLVLGLALTLTGACTVWISTVPALSAVGLLFGGLGVSGLFPVGLSVALQAAPEAQLQASARVTLASGAAILLAPSALGLAADAVGVVGAWAIVPGLAIAALTVVAMMPSGRPLPDILPDVLPDIVMDAKLEMDATLEVAS